MEIISTGTCSESAIPAVGHTQRATIDTERHEIHVMTVRSKYFVLHEHRNLCLLIEFVRHTHFIHFFKIKIISYRG